MAHKASLVDALSRAQSDRVTLCAVEMGRRGLLGYLKALGGSNVIKIVPANGSASESQAAVLKRLKVLCGPNTGLLEQGAFTDERTKPTFCEVRVSPRQAVEPNIGAGELAEALSRVLPFVSAEWSRPVLACVKIEAQDGALSLVATDGFALSNVTLPFTSDNWQALIEGKDLAGMIAGLRRAARARIGYEAGDGDKSGSLVIDTERIRYRWPSSTASYPKWQDLFPKESVAEGHFDTAEAVKAVNSLAALIPDTPINIVLGNGRLEMSTPDGDGHCDVAADTSGDVTFRLNASYLLKTLRACGGMADVKVTASNQPVVFVSDGFKAIVMPMVIPNKADTATATATSTPETTESATPVVGKLPETAPPKKVEPKPLKTRGTQKSSKTAQKLTKTKANLTRVNRVNEKARLIEKGKPEAPVRPVSSRLPKELEKAMSQAEREIDAVPA